MAPQGTPSSVDLVDATASWGPAPLTSTQVWLVIYNGEPIALSSSAQPAVGTWVGIVDASTGAYLYTEAFVTSLGS
jgi:hypothetical protein